MHPVLPNSVLLETNLIKEDEFRNFLFINPVEILVAYTFSELESLLKNIEFYIEKNLYLAGYISYEAGYLFEETFKKKLLQYKFPFPLAWFGVYEKPQITSHNSTHSPRIPGFSIDSLFYDLEENEYSEKIKEILEHIKKGETYQVNFTFKANFKFNGNIFSFYEALKKSQKVSYCALIHDGERNIISLSPELFFKRKENLIIAKPMKGTITRGKSEVSDNDLVIKLKTDPKTKAENSMIVDLIRNDLGKISEIGSVKVKNLLSIEKYETLFQMTSSVESVVRKNLTYFELLKAIFPGGSVTGAPKIRTMQIIEKLENSFRGIYTGAIGFISKDEAIFNIPIRTITIEDNKGEMGIGSGIVWDSESSSEYRECLLKQKFFINAIPFQLIESILIKNQNFVLLDLHLKRLENSANFFDFIFDRDKILQALIKFRHEIPINRAVRYKVKLVLDRDGQITLEYSNILMKNKIGGKTEINITRINSKNIFQNHKTTIRKTYDSQYKIASEKGLVDFIYLNQNEEVVEASIYNIIIKKDKMNYTPKLSSGALAGVMREYLIKKGWLIEKTLTITDLETADSIYFCNSVRGIMRVNLDFLNN